MCNENIDEQILRDHAEMRTALGQRYRWFCHVTPIGNLVGIRRDGLQPRSDRAAPDIVVRQFGADASNIICLSPLGAQDVGPPVQQGNRVCLAIENTGLPERLGLDWSFDGTIGLPAVLRRDHPEWSVPLIFVTVVHRRGSVISYDPIHRNALRVFAKDCPPHDLMRWPMLADTTDNDLVTF